MIPDPSPRPEPCQCCGAIAGTPCFHRPPVLCFQCCAHEALDQANRRLRARIDAAMKETSR